MIKPKLKICAGCELPKHIWKQHEGKRYCKDCWSKEKPTAPISRGTVSFKQQKPIPKQSPKRKKEDILYSIARLQFLKDNPMCFISIPGLCTRVATDIQHKKGRGIYLLDLRFWGSACRACHSYADTHPEEAFERGWAIPRLTKE